MRKRVISSWLSSRSAACSAASLAPYCSKAAKHVVAIERQNLPPKLRIAAGHAGRVQHARAGQAEILLGHRQRQGRGRHVRQMARQGHRLIVLLGRHLNRPPTRATAKTAPSRSKSSARVFLVGVRIASRPSNKSAEALAAPAFSLPAKGWLPRKRQPWPKPPSSAVDDRLLRAAGVGNQDSLGTMLGGLANVLDDLADRRADDDQFGLGHALVQVDRGMGDGPHAACNPQTGLPAADADHVFRQISLAQGHADRPADQPDPHDGNGIPLFHGVFPASTFSRRTCLPRWGEIRLVLSAGKPAA